MRRKVEVVLVAGGKSKKRKRVTVESLTLGRFLRLLTMAAARASATALLYKDPKPAEYWINAMTPEDFLELTDIACPCQPPRWYARWASVANTWRILGAMVDTNDVVRLRGSLALDGKPREGGSIQEEIHYICGEFPGLTPPIVKEWYMDDFLDVRDGFHAVLARRAPEVETHREASPLSTFAGIPGVQIVTH